MKILFLSMIMLATAFTAFSQQNPNGCLRVLSGTGFETSGSNQQLKIVYETNGQKTLETTIYCNGDSIMNFCFTSNEDGVKIFEINTPCGTIGQLTAKFVSRAGECGSAQCGTTQFLVNNVLPITFKSVNVVRITKNQFKVSFEVDEVSGTNNVYKVRLSTDGINFVDRAVIFPDDAKSGAKYEAIIRL